jgi:acyl carrier protein
VVRLSYHPVRSAVVEQSEIESVVISVIEAIQELSGRKSINISRTTCPLMDLEDFDSLNAVEVTIGLEEKLGIEFGTNNAFLAEDGKTPLNVAGIAKRLAAHLNAGPRT